MRTLLLCIVILTFYAIHSAAQSLQIDVPSEFNQKIKVGESGFYMKNFTGGSLQFGPDNGTHDELEEVGKAKFTYTFFAPFSTIPHITATARHPANTAFSDVFAVTIQSVSTTEVTFLIKRVDSNVGWGMNVLVDWWGFEL